MKNKLFLTLANFSAVVLLFALIAAPIYFAKSFSQVAGVKSESAYLLVSQIEKFPGMAFSQSANTYTITFAKQAQSQAYLSILIINNPTNESKTYTITSQSTENKIFFGEDLKNQLKKINIPAQSSAPISLFSQRGADSQKVVFEIKTD